MRQLEVRDFQVLVRLGCTKEEQSIPQKVNFSLEITLPGGVAGESTDRLSDTVCYADICGLIREVAQSKEFHLVEHLGHEVGRGLSKVLTDDFRLSVHKLHPPVDGLGGGVIYHIDHHGTQ